MWKFSQQFVYFWDGWPWNRSVSAVPELGWQTFTATQTPHHQATCWAFFRAIFKAYFRGPVYSWRDQMFQKGTFWLGSSSVSKRLTSEHGVEKSLMWVMHIYYSSSGEAEAGGALDPTDLAYWWDPGQCVRLVLKEVVFLRMTPRVILWHMHTRMLCLPFNSLSLSFSISFPPSLPPFFSFRFIFWGIVSL